MKFNNVLLCNTNKHTMFLKHQFEDELQRHVLQKKRLIFKEHETADYNNIFEKSVPFETEISIRNESQSAITV